MNTKIKAKTRRVKQPMEEALCAPLAGAPNCFSVFVSVVIHVFLKFQKKDATLDSTGFDLVFHLGFDLGFHLGFHLGFDHVKVYLNWNRAFYVQPAAIEQNRRHHMSN